MEIFTSSASETKKLARQVVDRLKGGETIALFGDLGSGKTTFVQGLAEVLGIKGRVLSPSYVLIRQHQIPSRNKQRNISTLYHVDLYRLSGFGEISGLGLGEIISEPNSLLVIEWAERLGNALPQEAIKIYFTDLGNNKRKISVENI